METPRTECRCVFRTAREARIGARRTWTVERAAELGVIQSHLPAEEWSSLHKELARPSARAHSKLPDECDGLRGKSMWPSAFRYREGKSGWGLNLWARKHYRVARR